MMKNLSVVLLAVVLTTTAVGVESANNNNNKNERRLRGVNNRRRVQSLSPETIGGDNEEYQQPKPVDFFDTVDPATVQGFRVAMSVQDLRQVGHYIDWDKLHDEYLDAVYTLGDQPEQDSSSSSSSRQQQQRRNLGKKAKSGGANKKKKKRRTKRPRTDSSNRRRKRRQRRHEWDLNEIETDLHQQSEMNVENALPPMPDAHSPPQESSAMNPVNNNGSSSSSGGGRDGGGIVVATTELVPEETTTATAMASDTATTTTTGGGQGRAVGDGRDYVTASDGALVLTVNSDGEFADEEEEESDAARQQLPTDDMFTIGNEGIAIPIYNYTRGNCPDAGSSPRAVPCAPDNLSQICSKYSGQGSFSACFDACRPSFCCVHDAPPATNTIAPNCNTDVNCAQYAYCYIVWWKLHDTIGPATELRLEQTDDFYDVNASFVQGDVTNIAFYREMLFHHFNDANEIIRLGTVDVNATLSVFSSDRIFLNSTYWNTTI